ncbi:MAG: FtsX-like permease family protein [Solirubrobacteraceae bacterium]
MTRRIPRGPVGMRPSMLLFLYRRRLRAHPVQELLAGAGIAVGVALVFGVLLANSSLTSSAGELVHGLIGNARLALSARSSEGLPTSLTERVRDLPGVQAATPVLRQSATVVGPRGRERVQLIGVAPSHASHGGLSTQELQQGSELLSSGVALPASVSQKIGAHPDSTVQLLSRGFSHAASVRLQIAGGTLQALADSPVVIASLATSQQLSGRLNRASEVLVEPRPGADAAVARELHALARSRLDVTSADNELRLLAQATQPNRQSTSLFSAISVIVGFLLALNAMLLTVPERRRFIAELRIQGYGPSQVLALLAFEALCLGLMASLVGVLLGELLSETLFAEIPAYLSAAFPLGSHQTIHAGTVALAVLCGVLATALASVSPALDLRPSLPPDAVLREAVVGGGETLRSRTIAYSALAGVGTIALVGVVVALVPSLTLLGGVGLALATLFLMPAALAMLARVLPWATQYVRGGAVVVAVTELRAITVRSVALAGIAGLAVYGCVAIGGTRADLLRGIDDATLQYHHTADVWVTNSGDIFNTEAFPVGDLQARIRHLPQVSAVRAYYGGLSDIGSRRLWVRARPTGDSTLLEPSQIVRGEFGVAQRLLREGGWAAVSVSLADELHLHVGSPFTLPTPSGNEHARVAAITTNSGWPSGTVTLSAQDYRRWWKTSEATALEVSLRAGMNAEAGARAVRALLGSRPGLTAESVGESIGVAKASARQGLRTLNQISTLLLIAAGLAVASALSATLWQRRARLASLKIQGYDPAQLWRGLLMESAAMLAMGSVAGALMGVFGHTLASRWLTLSTGFPAPFAVGMPQVFLTLGLIIAIALAVIALPGMMAARVSPRLSLQE